MVFRFLKFSSLFAKCLLFVKTIPPYTLFMILLTFRPKNAKSPDCQVLKFSYDAPKECAQS